MSDYFNSARFGLRWDFCWRHVQYFARFVLRFRLTRSLLLSFTQQLVLCLYMLDHFSAEYDFPLSKAILEELLNGNRRFIVELVVHKFVYRFHESVIIFSIQFETFLRHKLSNWLGID